MAMQTGENEQALRKILDMTRLISIVILLIHFYYYCYTAFQQWGFVSGFSDKILVNIQRTGLFSNFHKSKIFTLGFLLISLLGAKGRKEEKLNHKTASAYIITGVLIYFLSYLSLLVKTNSTTVAILYISITTIGFLMVLSGGTLLSRIIKNRFNNKDIFNKENETFPQEERLLENEYSINLPARYHLKDKVRNSWLNIINPFRALMVLGTPGSGKSYFVIRHVITQHIRKGFTMFIYDFKFDDLSKITYNTWLKYKHLYPVPPQFYVINFDDLTRSHRCNPLEPSAMTDITDAAESARTILLGLNKEWIKRQGDFFVESPINFLTAIIWYLKKYKYGQFCTLPHVIELMQLDYDSLFTILRTEKEIEVLINPFVNAYINDAMEQLEGQIASAKIAMARLSSPQLYYVLSGNDFTLDINNPEEPKIVCMGNNPQKIQTYGAVLSLYVSRLVKLVNQKGKLKSSLIFDEFYLDITGMDKFYGGYKWTNELAQSVTKETGLPISFALSINKTVSKIGTGEAKPKGNLEIPENKVRSFLNPLSIQKIPMVGDVTFQLLSRIGIRTIQKLSEMPAEVLQRMIGKNGIDIWKKANGIDNNPVEPYTERKSISTEHTFSQDTIDIPKLKSILIGMVEKLAFQLRSEEWLTSTVVIKIRYSNFDTETKQCKIAYTSADHTLTKTVTDLFDKVYQRRMRLRLIGIRFSGLVRGTYQINLFEDTEEMLSLYQAMDKMKTRYGFDAVMRCAGATFKPNNKSEILKRKL